VSAFATPEPRTASAAPVDPEISVTPRQLELLALCASGYGYEHIGRLKFLSPYTVQNYLRAAVKRSGARSVTHLCSVAVEQGLIRRNAEGVYEPVQDLRIVGE
jgi:DNA-binding NarL/FixJ family response regulator